MPIIVTHYCSVKNCGRPSRSQSDQTFGAVTLRIWLCELHGEDAREPELEIDTSRTSFVLKTAVPAS